MKTTIRRRPRIGSYLACLLLAAAAGLTWAGSPVAAEDTRVGSGMGTVIPAPAEVHPAPGHDYQITSETHIYTQTGSSGATKVGRYLAEVLRPSTGYPLPVSEATGSGNPRGIVLLLSGARARVGDEGYRLQVTGKAVVIRATTSAGLFAGVQTLRQLLPPKVERDSVQEGPWTVPGGRILDRPRFAYRGAMLDVARHFFTVEEVKSYLDLLALYKVNYLHLHLADDQGWRIMIDSWPRLAKYGGSTEVDGGPGGYYTKDEYREIIDYAQARHITIVPEIDMPGHTNAALASYDKLNCDGTAPPLYTGTDVGFSSLCVDKEITYDFVDDVIRELAAMTPGPYLHIGGDEAHSTSPEDYNTFMDRVLPIVRKYGKRPFGWHQIVGADPKSSAVAQFWGTSPDAPDVAAAAKEGMKLIVSPADRAYLDMKYNENTELGLTWAGYSTVRDAYTWDPGSYINDVDASSVLGVEAELWSETLETGDDIEFMAFPRLPAIAELGWSPTAKHDWSSFRTRLAAHGPRLEALDVNFYRSPQVPWPADGN